ncbi:YcaO-like family protein [Kineosporia sp. NBRC 101731]|uniref:YcaO-like family protein n=1 Tax=Kineosporia sp. NBRC 101731 TaxID=3032199 RepID=UPI0024A1A174|nr:YcaO-like family protein [Kineosporia sp. NBRC 101731]GLY33855.1 methanogenesis marker 1 protein [Kineosporia sp. NBRC 101731]
MTANTARSLGSGLALRSRSLDEVEVLADALLERTGITRVSDVTGLDVLGIPVFQSVRPRAAAGLNTVTSGKGITAQGARVGAKMEAIERFYCEPAGRAPTPVPLADQRERMLTLDPRRLIPRRTHTWTPPTPLAWWPMRCLRSSAEIAVPALAVFTPFPGEASLMQSNTIGLAVGNDLVDATVQGLYEVIEHDCTAFGEKLRLGYRVPPETVPDTARELIDRFERASIRVTVHAYTGGLPVPAFFVTTEDTYARDGMLFNGGAGCHLNPEIALLRALTEAAQSRLAVIAGAREDLDEQAYRRHSSYDELRGYLHAWSAGRPERPFGAIPDRSTGDNEQDLALLLDILGQNSLDLVLRTELAPPGLPFTVVKIVVPGSEFAHVDKLRIGARLVAARDFGGSDWINA